MTLRSRFNDWLDTLGSPPSIPDIDSNGCSNDINSAYCKLHSTMSVKKDKNKRKGEKEIKVLVPIENDKLCGLANFSPGAAASREEKLMKKISGKKQMSQKLPRVAKLANRRNKKKSHRSKNETLPTSTREDRGVLQERLFKAQISKVNCDDIRHTDSDQLLSKFSLSCMLDIMASGIECIPPTLLIDGGKAYSKLGAKKSLEEFVANEISSEAYSRILSTICAFQTSPQYPVAVLKQCSSRDKRDSSVKLLWTRLEVIQCLEKVLRSNEKSEFCISAIQSFVKSRGANAWILRCFCKNGTAGKAYVISATSDARITSTGSASTCEVVPAKGKSWENPRSIVRTLHQALTEQPGVPSRLLWGSAKVKRNLLRMAIDLVQDPDGDWWILQAKAIEYGAKQAHHPRGGKRHRDMRAKSAPHRTSSHENTHDWLSPNRSLHSAGGCDVQRALHAARAYLKGVETHKYRRKLLQKCDCPGEYCADPGNKTNDSLKVMYRVILLDRYGIDERVEHISLRDFTARDRQRMYDMVPVCKSCYLVYTKTPARDEANVEETKAFKRAMQLSPIKKTSRDIDACFTRLYAHSQRHKMPGIDAELEQARQVKKGKPRRKRKTKKKKKRREMKKIGEYFGLDIDASELIQNNAELQMHDEFSPAAEEELENPAHLSGSPSSPQNSDAVCLDQGRDEIKFDEHTGICCSSIFGDPRGKLDLCSKVSLSLRNGRGARLIAPFELNSMSLEDCRLVLRSLYLELRKVCVDQGFFPDVPIINGHPTIELFPRQ